ncbi:MAG: hypothetical protein QXW80_05350 [Candidatus Micrarchaeia archaeon]
MSKFIFAMFTILILVAFTFALSDLGGSCRYTGECREGFCLNNTCRFPQVLEKYIISGNCSYTAQCKDGFCKDGECIIPLREETQLLSFGIKSGCAGIIENCTGYFCLLCDFSWILLIVSASIASFIGRKRGRLLPVLLFGLPMLLGFIVFPVLGFMLALIEILILGITKRKVSG